MISAVPLIYLATLGGDAVLRRRKASINISLIFKKYGKALVPFDNLFMRPKPKFVASYENSSTTYDELLSLP